jgi:glycosyltransferase involved in cell wall biosynthesis
MEKEKIMEPLSVVVITYNEEKNIGRCLASVKDIADEIVIVDSLSTDRTEEICKSFNARFFVRSFDGYVQQKQYATDLAQYPWIFSIDADEAVSHVLRQNIKEIKQKWKFDAFFCSRLTNYCGKFILHGDWYPDKKIRLFDRRCGSWTGGMIHEGFNPNPRAAVGRCKGDILHFSYTSISRHIEQLNYFTDIMAKDAQAGGKKSPLSKIIFNPFWKFIKSYIFRLGFLDGYFGFVIAVISSFATFIKYVKLRELIKSGER